MALLVCEGCSTPFAVGLPRCPNCTSTNCHPQGEEETMPKIHRDGRVTDRTQPDEPASAPVPAAPEDKVERRPEPATRPASRARASGPAKGRRKRPSS